MNVYKQNVRRVQRKQCCVREPGRVGALKSVKENEKGTRLSEIKNKGEIQPLGTEGGGVTGKEAGLGSPFTLQHE